MISFSKNLFEIDQSAQMWDAVAKEKKPTIVKRQAICEHKSLLTHEIFRSISVSVMLLVVKMKSFQQKSEEKPTNLQNSRFENDMPLI